jgi:hypothetical protein
MRAARGNNSHHPFFFSMRLRSNRCTLDAQICLVLFPIASMIERLLLAGFINRRGRISTHHSASKSKGCENLEFAVSMLTKFHDWVYWCPDA